MSADHAQNTKVRPGNPHLKAPSASRRSAWQETKDTYPQARYKRLTARRGPLTALVAVEHSIITAIWHIPTGHIAYQDLGGTHFTQRDTERAARRAINQLNQLGCTITITLDPRESAA